MLLYDVVRLARLDKPTGFYLLFLPCTWGLALSEAPLEYWFIFFFGALMGRSAGCIYNDFVDRKKDKLVERTKNRPIASGRVSPRVGLLLAALFALGALVSLMFLPYSRVITALFSIPLALLYPFMKRVTWIPQLWLGITFNWGVFVAGGINPVTGLMYLGGVFWTLAYDTLYGFQDYNDDGRAGIKSLPRMVGYERGLRLVNRLYMLAILCWFAAGTLGFHNPFLYYPFCAASLVFSRFHLRKLDLRNPAQCAGGFKMEPIFGGLVTIGILATKFIL